MNGINVLKYLMVRNFPKLVAAVGASCVWLVVGCQAERRTGPVGSPTPQLGSNANLMELQNQTWTWQKTVFNNDTTKQPRQVGAFTLTFDEYGRVAGTTDCNSFHGSVVVSDHNLKFEEPMAMTRMFCPDSQEAEFVKMLHAVNSFLFTSRGELVLELKYDSGSMFFD